MEKSMNINQGEIWMVNFEPSIGSEIQKLRPAIVVNDDKIGRYGLAKDSSIECFQIKSFAVDRFDKKIGEIDKSLLLQVHKTIAKTLNPTYKIN